MKEEYTLADMVDFGNYILSEDRMSRTSIILKEHVTHADLCNWKDKKKSKTNKNEY